MGNDQQDRSRPEARAGQRHPDTDDLSAPRDDQRDAHRGNGGPGTGGDALRATGSALFGRDLLMPRPPLLPWGRRGRAYRRRRQEILARARARREQVWRDFTASAGPPPRVPASRPWQPVDRWRNIAVSTGLSVLVCAVFVLAMRYADRPADTGSTAPDPTVVAAPATAATGTPSAPPSAAPVTPGTSGGRVRPIPSGGVRALAPPAPRPVDPASIVLVAPPAGEATLSELGSPDGAVRAWLARTCPFDWHDPFGVPESRGRSAMTQAGWEHVDPAGDATARVSWSATVEARETGRCAAPAATVDPEAPGSATAVIVIGSVARVVTGTGDAPYVETVEWTGWVRRGPDGLWRVDVASVGG